MFTGIVADRGTVRRARMRKGVLELDIDTSLGRQLSVGDSVAVNGVCLTATATHRRHFSTQAMPETLARTTMADLRRGSGVNLELPARLLDRLGGHLVQGHTDGTATALRVEKDGGATRTWWEASEELLRYLVPKGSVTLDGISLTVVDVGRTSFEVALIPHTLDVTTLEDVRAGSVVNVEIDIVAKYVERLAAPSESQARR